MTPHELVTRWRQLADTLDAQVPGFRFRGNELAALIYSDSARLYREAADELEGVLNPSRPISCSGSRS